MIAEIIEVKALAGHRLYLKFKDGAEGTLDFRNIAPFKGVFEPLADQKNFEKVALNPIFKTVQWEGGADIAPETLYKLVTGKIIPA
jgi:hypothetical protein